MSTTAPSPTRHEAVEQGVLDVLGVGVGPFNLGLAAMLDGSAPDLASRFLERGERFAWHPGMLLEGTTLQVPFLADLVTLADPTSRWSFLAYLHDRDRLFPFYLQERFHVPRAEYDDYCRWVAERLPSCAFGHEVRDVAWDPAREALAVRVTVRDGDGAAGAADDAAPEPARDDDTGAAAAPVREETLHARSLVLGIGSAPHVPPAFAGLPDELAFHSARYRDRREAIGAGAHVVVVGSGQSGAEVVLDLLRRPQEEAVRVTWLARTPAFAPMEYSKLGLEQFTPDYTAYVRTLPQEERDRLVPAQWQLYKAVSGETLGAIHDLLYERSIGGGWPEVRLTPGVAVEAAEDRGGVLRLHGHHREQDARLELDADRVVLATGYRMREPDCLAGLGDAVARDEAGRLAVDDRFEVPLAEPVRARLFVQNGELHTHGVGAPDLGLGAWRAATIVNALTGEERVRLPRRSAYTTFGVEPA